MKYWLMKSEPSEYSIENLKKDKTLLWYGVRNYQARNIMIDGMKKGDMALFYHSNCKPSAVVGLCEIHKEAAVDPTAFDKKSKYFDAKSDPDKPRWKCVTVKYKKTFKMPVTLHDIKAVNSLSKMVLVNNSRLSVQPVTAAEFKKICTMAEA